MIGVRYTDMVQLAPAPTEVPQLLDCEKFGDVVEIFEIVMEVGPVFVSVRFCGGLTVPTSCVPNVRLMGERDTTVPLSWSSTETEGVVVELLDTTRSNIPSLLRSPAFIWDADNPASYSTAG
jgi:hypothetical protein